ncbi:MAG: 30S ribosomal protein S16 [Pseudomonadota bacterium]
MIVVIRLTRRGNKNRPAYRIVAADKRSPRDGAYIDDLGYYVPTLPKNSDMYFKINMDRFNYWVKQGAQYSSTVGRLVKVYGGQDKNAHQDEDEKKIANS